MSGEQEFDIIGTIDEKTGDLSVRVEGIKGEGCMGVMEQFDQAGIVVSDERTGEYFEEGQTVQRVARIQRR